MTALSITVCWVLRFALVNCEAEGRLEDPLYNLQPLASTNAQLIALLFLTMPWGMETSFILAGLLLAVSFPVSVSLSELLIATSIMELSVFSQLLRTKVTSVYDTFRHKLPPCVRALSHIWPCGPTHCSLPGSSVHGIFQSRILEWIAISFSRGSSKTSDRTHIPCVSCNGWRVLYLCITREPQTSPCSVPNEIWFLRETENFRAFWSYGLTDRPTTRGQNLDHMAVKLGPGTQACFFHKDVLLFSRES